MKLCLLFILAIGLQGCISLDSISSTFKTSASSYKTVKDANSLNTVSDAIKTLAITREKKAAATQSFIDETAKAIKSLPAKYRAYLLAQVLEVKLGVAKSTYFNGVTHASAFLFLLFFLVMIIKYVFDRVKPKVKSATYS